MYRAVLLVLACCYGALVEGATVIANASVEVEQLSQNALRAVYSMRQGQWPDGQPIQVFVLPDAHPVHQKFAKGVLGIFPYQLRRNWDRLTFSGLGNAPRTVSDEAAMRRAVATTPGAIGYVADTAVDDQRVKSIAVGN